MKSASRSIIIFAVVFMSLATGAHAANPREELKQLTAQLQGNPNDTALREKIIKLAITIKPATAIPEDARKSFVRGNSAFADAKNPEDFDRAITQYREASKLAPWWGDVYFNLAKALEQRQNYGEAAASLKLYLLAVPGARDARATQDRIYVLEEKAERTAKEGRAKAERQQWAADIVQWLRTNYGGRLQKIINCGAPGHRYAMCTETEARGNNWRSVGSQVNSDSIDLRSDNLRFSYTTHGPDNDSIKVVFLSPGIPQATSDEYCGVPTSNDIGSVSWSQCRDPSKAVRIRWTRDSSNKPLIDFVGTCDGGDLCPREQYTLEN